MNTKKASKAFTFFQSFLLNLPYLALSLLLADQKYEISDDFIIDNVLSGAVGPDYASRAPYINRLLGEFLSFINRHTSDFSVFFYFQLAVSLLSFTALTYILLRRGLPPSRPLPAGLSFSMPSFIRKMNPSPSPNSSPGAFSPSSAP